MSRRLGGILSRPRTWLRVLTAALILNGAMFLLNAYRLTDAGFTVWRATFVLVSVAGALLSLWGVRAALAWERRDEVDQPG